MLKAGLITWPMLKITAQLQVTRPL
jgi:hypothetical protein